MNSHNWRLMRKASSAAESEASLDSAKSATRRLQTARILGLCGIAALLLAAACSSNNNNGNKNNATQIANNAAQAPIKATVVSPTAVAPIGSSAASPSALAAAGAQTITEITTDNKFSETKLTVKAGQPISLTVKNNGAAVHNWDLLNQKDANGKDIKTDL